MKTKPFLLAASMILVACNNNAAERKAPVTDNAKQDTHIRMPPAPEKNFEGIVFANKTDYICFMPVTAGVEDTAMYKGNVYGFCSKECKEEFLKNPKQYLTAKK